MLFFPFEPYRLPKSNAFIQGVYREWSSVAIEDEDDEDDENTGTRASVRIQIYLSTAASGRGTQLESTTGSGIDGPT